MVKQEVLLTRRMGEQLWLVYSSSLDGDDLMGRRAVDLLLVDSSGLARIFILSFCPIRTDPKHMYITDARHESPSTRTRTKTNHSAALRPGQTARGYKYNNEAECFTYGH